MIESNANVSNFQDTMSMIEKLSKGVKNMNEKMSDVVRRVEKINTTTNLDQSNPNIEIMGGKENEVDYNQGTFLSQPTIHFKNTFHVNNHASLCLEENYVISILNEKSSSHPYDTSFEDEIEKKEKRNDDLILEDIDPIVPNESLDMIYEDQKSYVDDEFSFNEIVKHSKKDICIENVLEEFLEDFFTDEKDENVEEFPTNEEEQGEI